MGFGVQVLKVVRLWGLDFFLFSGYGHHGFRVSGLAGLVCVQGRSVLSSW